VSRGNSGSSPPAPQVQSRGIDFGTLSGSVDTMPPVVVSQVALRGIPMVDSQVYSAASATHQTFNQARTDNIAAVGSPRSIARSPRPLRSQPDERSPTQDHAVHGRSLLSGVAATESRGRDVGGPIGYPQVQQQTRTTVSPQPPRTAPVSPSQAVVGVGNRQAAAGNSRSGGTGQPALVSLTQSGGDVGMLTCAPRNQDEEVGGSLAPSAQQPGSSAITARQLGQLEAIAAHGTGYRQGEQQQRELQLSEAAVTDAGWTRVRPDGALASAAGGPAQPQSDTGQETPGQLYSGGCKDMPVPTSPQEMQRIRNGGLLKMETPTEWSVDSHRKSPSPERVDTGHESVPVAVQRLLPTSARSPRPSSQEQSSLSPGRRAPSQQGSLSPGRSPGPSARGRAAPQEVAEPPPRGKLPATLADMVAYSDSRTAAAMEAAPVSFGSAMHSDKVSPMVMIRSTAPSSRRNMADPLPTEASTSSVGSGTLPLQDSITSTIDSASSFHRKQGGSRAPASRGRALNSSTGFRSAVAGSSNGFASAKTAPSRGPSTEFSPGLGFGDRPAGTAQMSQSASSWRATQAEGPMQMSQSCSSFHPVPVEGASPPPRRTRTAGGQRDITWGSRSTGSLPLTFGGARNISTASPSPMRPRRTQPISGNDRMAQAELAAANSESHLPELLPAFKPGKIHKGPKPPSWLVAL